MTKTYKFQAKLWLYPGKAAWHFITLPKDIADDIDFCFSHEKRGWSSLPVNVTIGKTTWRTSIFPDKESESYLLPIKKEVRTKEELEVHATISVSLVLKS